MKCAISLKLLSFLKLLIMASFLLACVPAEPPSQLSQIYQQQQLRVGLLHSPTSYYIGIDGPAGFEYELSTRLAEQLGVELVVDPSFDLQELMQKLQQGQVDYIAGGLTLTDARLAQYRAAPAYQWVNEQLVFRQGQPWPRSLDDIQQPVAVIAGSSHAETMQQLQQHYPHLEFQEFHDRDGDELLQMVVEDRLAYTLTDSNQLAINRRFFPNLSIAFTVQEDRPIGWLLPKNDDDSLHSVLIEFFGDLYQSGDLVTLEDRYFGHIRQFDYVDTLKFIEAIEQVLPDYQPLFQQYAGTLDWRLLAALSYQESHWDPRARSATGVRGMM
ncbi:MAG: membrane-bound lytic murein transglycosylase MltF, partial [Alkalimonas sp.]|nr:membrane-bound lytic murein transglycosylase MltF [Alkalimonas sp.]